MNFSWAIVSEKFFVLGKENEVPWKKRADKEQFVSDYGERLKKKPDFILAEYKGLTAAEMSQLRKTVREVSSYCSGILSCTR